MATTARGEAFVRRLNEARVLADVIDIIDDIEVQKRDPTYERLNEDDAREITLAVIAMAETPIVRREIPPHEVLELDGMIAREIRNIS
jgi:hypothetical protein